MLFIIYIDDFSTLKLQSDWVAIVLNGISTMGAKWENVFAFLVLFQLGVLVASVLQF